LFFKWSTRFM